MLRLCNELLRRLSRAEDPVFCGRVYIFLFQSFPLGDKSSVNIRGNFHVENVTTFEDYLKASISDEDGMQVDTDRAVDVKEDSKPEVTVDEPAGAKKTPNTMDIDALYPVFWSLQHSFSNPPKLFEEDSFKDFKHGLEATLAKFKEVPKVIQSGDPEAKKGAVVKLRSDDNTDDLASNFNPKYLTSRDLFKLEVRMYSLVAGAMTDYMQLSDLAFQRHILVQALILIDFLLTLTEKGKKKSYYQNAQRAMQYTFTLREEDVSPCHPYPPRKGVLCATIMIILSADRKAQTQWALGIKKAIADYLQDGPDGKFYYRMVDTVLSRDKNWVRWKMENCQPFTRDRVPTKDFQEAKSGAESELRRKTVSRPMGKNSSLQFLNSDAEKGLAKLKQADRYVPLARLPLFSVDSRDVRFTLPSAESYEKKFRVNVLDLDMVTSEEEKRQLEERKTSNTWRGLRLASKHQLSTFDRLEQGKGLERLFQPVSSIEAAGEDHAPSGPESRGPHPQEQHQSVGRSSGPTN